MASHPRPAAGRASAGPYRSSRGSVPPVVVQFSSADETTVRDLSEDLDVMTHILDQSLAEGADEAPQQRMGINLLFSGSQRLVRALYLEDFGALFMVKVNFPLQGAAEQKPKEPSKGDNDWERARREVLGISDPSRAHDLVESQIAYDPKRVEDLKSFLVRALKNASNIRHLKADEAVTISVFGSPSLSAGARESGSDAPAPRTSSSKRVEVRRGGGEAQVESQLQAGEKQLHAAQRALADVTRAFGGITANSSYGQGTVLTVRVKKSDVDAFSKGDLDEDAFTKKVGFNAYTGAGHGVASVNSWIGEIVR